MLEITETNMYQEFHLLFSKSIKSFMKINALSKKRVGILLEEKIIKSNFVGHI